MDLKWSIDLVLPFVQFTTSVTNIKGETTYNALLDTQESTRCKKFRRHRTPVQRVEGCV